MRSLTIFMTAAMTLLAMPAHATEGDRVVVYDRLFADGFVANEQAYVVFEVPAGLHDVAFELDCNLGVGTLSLVGGAMGSEGTAWSGECDGLTARVAGTALVPGYYYGVASFTGVNGVVFRATVSSG